MEGTGLSTNITLYAVWTANSYIVKYDTHGGIQVFNDDEVALMANYIINNYTSTKELGILLAFLTGVRVGELCTLKSSDHEGYRLYIQRTEIS